MKLSSARLRMFGLVAIVAVLMGLVAVSPSSATNTVNAVRLHLDSGGRYFAFGSTTQSLKTAKNSCQLTSAETLIDLSSTPSGSTPGLVSDGLGVRPSGGSNGTPCSQVDSVESLTLARGPSLGSRRFNSVRLDLEMTGNAVVLLTFTSGSTTATYRLQTGTSVTTDQSGESGYDRYSPYLVSSGPGDETDACAAPNSSGPNSHGSDNCQWRVTPGFDFDSITLTTTRGTVALEGGGDFGGSSSYETLLYIADAAPTVVNDTATTAEDTAVAGNVLTNDSDPEGKPLTASLATPPANGTATVASNGNFNYTPRLDWSGTDSFTYSASDGAKSTIGTVTVTVTPVNDRPVANNGTSSTPEDTSVTITVATDVDSTALDADCTSSGGGTIVDNGDGTVRFTPPVDFTGSITVTCTVTDDAGATALSSAVVVVGVTNVNDPPVANDDVADVDAGSSVSIDVLDNDDDIDGDELSVTDIAAVSPEGATAIVGEDGTVTYTPPAEFAGEGSFTYRASDGEETSEPATVLITVVPVICSNETVTDTEGDVTGAFTRLDDPFECKRYGLAADDESDNVLFTPTGGSIISYRGLLEFDPEPAPIGGGPGTFTLLLRYDPTGGTDYQPVQWCVAPVFDGDGAVTSATLPAGESWCVASADTRGAPGGLVTTWQVYGVDDPRFAR